MKVRILLFKKSISRWKNVFVVWPTDVSTFRPLTVTPSAALRSVGHKPRTPMSNNIIITGGYFIVGDVIKIFSLKKNKTKNWIVCFFLNIWPISQQIDHSILFLIFFYFRVLSYRRKKKKKKHNFSVIILTSISSVIQCHDQGRNPSVPIIQNQLQQNKKNLVFWFVLFRIECLDWTASSFFFIPTNPTRVGISHVHSTSVSPGPVRVCIFWRTKGAREKKEKRGGMFSVHVLI